MTMTLTTASPKQWAELRKFFPEHYGNYWRAIVEREKGFVFVRLAGLEISVGW